MEFGLKKCPFCGGDGQVIVHNGRHGMFVGVSCKFCRAQGRTYSYHGDWLDRDNADFESVNLAVDAWNKRCADA